MKAMLSSRANWRLAFLLCPALALGCADSGGETPGGIDAADDGTAPTVTSTAPADNELAVAPDGPITMVFSEPMNPETITTNTADGECSGSLQVSADAFANCVQMRTTPSSDDNTTFQLTPESALLSATAYSIRVTSDAADAGGTSLASPFETTTGFTTRYFHSIQIDENNDFVSNDEGFAASTTGAQLFVSYDANALYVGLSHADIVVGGDGNKFVYFLFSTDATLATGNSLSSDDKAKFGDAGTHRMSHHWKERVDGASYTEFRVSDGANWDTDWTATGKVVHRSAGLIEASIALSEFGTSAPSTLIITAYTIDYDGDTGNGYLYNMLSGATDGSGATSRDLVGYVGLTLPSSQPPNDPSHLKTF